MTDGQTDGRIDARMARDIDLRKTYLDHQKTSSIIFYCLSDSTNLFLKYYFLIEYDVQFSKLISLNKTYKIHT